MTWEVNPAFQFHSHLMPLPKIWLYHHFSPMERGQQKRDDLTANNRGFKRWNCTQPFFSQADKHSGLPFMKETFLFQDMVRFRTAAHLQKVRDLDDIHGKEVPGQSKKLRLDNTSLIYQVGDMGKKVAEVFFWKNLLESQGKNFDLSKKDMKENTPRYWWTSTCCSASALFSSLMTQLPGTAFPMIVSFCEPKWLRVSDGTINLTYGRCLYMLIERGALSMGV